jgi:hypothetical protein
MSVIPSFSDMQRRWHLYNRDTAEIFSGQFHAEDLTHEGVGSVYSDRWALNRRHPITQFVRGELERVSFRGRFHATTSLETLEDQINFFKTWARRDEKLKRPPVLEFFVGNGDAEFFEQPCLLESVNGIKYDRPTLFGGMRQVTFTVTLREYKEQKIAAGPTGETRYHRAKQGEYYELIAFYEYGQPLLGDVIRKRHPSQPAIAVGDVVKLPSVEKVRTQTVAATSVPLETAFGRKETPQRTLRIDWFDKRDVSHVSHILTDH